MGKPSRGHIWTRQTKAGTVYCWKTVLEIDGVKRQRMRSGFRTRAEAQKSLTAALAESDKGAWSDPVKMTYAAWFRTWISGHVASPGTIRSYEHTAQTLLIPHIGSVRLSDLRPVRIRKLWKDLADHGGRNQKPLSPASVARAHVVLSGSLKQAVLDGMIEVNPCRNAPVPKPGRKPDRDWEGWDEAAVDRFLAWADKNSTEYAPLWRAYARTGCRRGELLGLRWKDVSASKISIRQAAKPGEGNKVEFGDTKTHRERVVDHYRDTRSILLAWKSERGSLHLSLVRPDSLVFADHNGNPHHPIAITQRFALDMSRYRDSLGSDPLPRIVLHGLRHIHASHLISAGVPVSEMASRLGHSTTECERTYRHYITGSQSMWFERLGLHEYPGGYPVSR